MSAGGLLAGGLGGGGVSLAEPVLLVSERPVPLGPPAPGLSSVTTLSSSLLDSPAPPVCPVRPELVRSGRSGLRAITEVRFEGIGNEGLGRLCIAASACCTASCRTSALDKTNNLTRHLARINIYRNIMCTGIFGIRKTLISTNASDYVFRARCLHVNNNGLRTTAK
jgi:hypothetical protein